MQVSRSTLSPGGAYSPCNVGVLRAMSAWPHDITGRIGDGRRRDGEDFVVSLTGQTLRAAKDLRDLKSADDMELLRLYARNGSQEAFQLLVTRHINWVYSMCLRGVKDRHL